MSKKDRAEVIEIEIYDQRYPLRLKSPAEGRQIQKIAEEVDRRMREIARQTGTVDSLKVAILTALHLAEERRVGASDGESLDAEVRAMADRCIRALDEVLEEQ